MKKHFARPKSKWDRLLQNERQLNEEKRLGSIMARKALLEFALKEYSNARTSASNALKQLSSEGDYNYKDAPRLSAMPSLIALEQLKIDCNTSYRKLQSEINTALKISPVQSSDTLQNKKVITPSNPPVKRRTEPIQKEPDPPSPVDQMNQGGNTSFEEEMQSLVRDIRQQVNEINNYRYQRRDNKEASQYLIQAQLSALTAEADYLARIDALVEKSDSDSLKALKSEIEKLGYENLDLKDRYLSDLSGFFRRGPQKRNLSVLGRS